MKYTEAEMVTRCYNDFLKSDNYKVVLLEVPYMSRCIDMLMVNRDDELISIEFKISKWKDAMEQAIDHFKGSDKAYICLPEPRRSYSDELYQRLRETGIGLLYYSDKCDEPIKVCIESIPRHDKWNIWSVSLKDKVNSLAGGTIF